MAILLDGKTLEPPLPHMAVTSVMVMISPDMTGDPPLHEGTECATGTEPDHQTKMVKHEES